MEKRKLSINESIGHVLIEATAQHDSNQDSPAEEEQDYEIQGTSSIQLQATRQARLDNDEQNKKLALEHTALMEQMTTKPFCWEQEKKKRLKTLELARICKNQQKMDGQIKLNEKKVRLLEKLVHEQQAVTEVVKCDWEKEARDIKVTFNETLKALNTEWDNRWFLRQEEREYFDKKIQEKDDLIINMRNENAVLQAKNSESEAKLREKEMEVVHSEAEWNKRLKALEDQLATKEQNFKRAQELQREERRKVEEERRNKVSQMEEEIKLLTQHNSKLQELPKKTDKEKAKMKKDEEKAKIEAERRQKKERREEQGGEKKDKSENEKEELKRQQKEREGREKKGETSFLPSSLTHFPTSTIYPSLFPRPSSHIPTPIPSRTSTLYPRLPTSCSP